MTTFSACGDDENDGESGAQTANSTEIVATNVIDFGADIDTVKAVTYRIDLNAGGAIDGFEEIATATYSNNGFKITLPETLSAEYLRSYAEMLTSFGVELPDGIVVSDMNAKIGNMNLLACDKNGEVMATFLLSDGSLGWQAYYLYADRNFTLKGEFADENGISASIDYSLKKGWNTVYIKIIENEGIAATTQKPANVNFVWFAL
jgi:hypothetical protein